MEHTAIVRPLYFDIYQDGKGEWRYRFRASNGNILCMSGDGYKTRQGCRGAMTRFISKVRSGDIIGSAWNKK
jgi:uncharacterized protein YegP (UPF0339 family)